MVIVITNKYSSDICQVLHNTVRINNEYKKDDRIERENMGYNCKLTQGKLNTVLCIFPTAEASERMKEIAQEKWQKENIRLI